MSIIVSWEGVNMPAKKDELESAEKLRQYRKGYREGYKEGYKAAVNDIKEKMKSQIDDGTNPRWPHIWPFG
jgi:flagellar biosynthesis/type III secretory pathway protein FliH